MKGQFKLGHTHGQRDIFTFRAASLQIRSSKERIKTNTYLLFSFSCLIWRLTTGQRDHGGTGGDPGQGAATQWAVSGG